MKDAIIESLISIIKRFPIVISSTMLDGSSIGADVIIRLTSSLDQLATFDKVLARTLISAESTLDSGPSACSSTSFSGRADINNRLCLLGDFVKIVRYDLEQIFSQKATIGGVTLRAP